MCLIAKVVSENLKHKTVQTRKHMYASIHCTNQLIIKFKYATALFNNDKSPTTGRTRSIHVPFFLCSIDTLALTNQLKLQAEFSITVLSLHPLPGGQNVLAVASLTDCSAIYVCQQPPLGMAVTEAVRERFKLFRCYCSTLVHIGDRWGESWTEVVAWHGQYFTWFCNSCASELFQASLQWSIRSAQKK